MAEVVSLVVTGLLVVLCLWLLGSTKSFTALKESNSRQVEVAGVYAPGELGVAIGTPGAANTSDSELGRGLRRRVANIFDRKSQDSLATTVLLNRKRGSLMACARIGGNADGMGNLFIR